MPPLGEARGFTLVELLVSTTLLLGIMAAVYGAVAPARGAFRSQPEAADMQQRLRVAVDAISRELLGAGEGPLQGPAAGPLHRFLPPVLPYRQGRRNPDPAGSYRRDVITIRRVIAGAAQTSLASPLGAQAASIQVSPDPGCPAGDALCGFRAGMDVVVFDDSGASDAYTISSVQGATMNLVHNARDSGTIYGPATTRIAQASSRTFYLKTDARADTMQLMQYDGAGGADVPLVDHVVALDFQYLADPSTSLPGGDGDLTELQASQLTDGPWRPDATDPNRYDVDLLRVRAIEVTLRVEAASASLRGPAGSLFVRPGTGRIASGVLADQEIRFRVAPRNMVAGR